MNYNRLNIIGGWVVFLITAVVYTMTLEPTMPFWDCGEFIATANRMEVGHPPGAPLFMLIARVFSAFSAPENVPYMVNFLSAICSAATVMFLFWSITHMARKIAERQGDLNAGRIAAILGSGLVGGLAYTFSDTFWFSGVEGEVYAMSSLFTAAVFWAILKWESVADRGNELRWVVLIAYLMGLSIGVHLLNLLAIPAICFVYYFKKYEVTRKGIIITSLVSLGLLILIQTGIIIWFVQLAGFFERTFVNSFGMPFSSGAIFYAVLIIAAIVLGLRWTRRKNMVAANTLILGVTMAIIGYTTFATIIIRSQANPPMDENNPENLFSLLSYLNREQYGDRPLLSGQYFNTPEDPEEPYKDGGKVWVKSFSVREDNTKSKLVLSCRERFEAEQYVAANTDKKLKIVQEYIESGEKKDAVVNYDKRYTTVFPRMHSSQASHIREYKQWSNYKDWNTARGQNKVKELEQTIAELESEQQQISAYLNRQRDQLSADDVQQLERRYKTNERVLMKKHAEAMPSKSEDLRYFVSYQIGWMYWRYFMWNFSGRQDDSQGHGDFMDGNWISGVKWLDEARLGNRAELPEMEKNNRAHNAFFMLPLMLGLIGLIFQAVRHLKDFSVVGMLFLLTGLAIVVYLNQTPLQPRERDYAYAGSFYAFTIWIGLGIYALYYLATAVTFKQIITVAGMAVGGSLALYLLEGAVTQEGDSPVLGASLLYMSVVASVVMLVCAALGFMKGESLVKGLIVTAMGMPVPIIMAEQGWDDHDRSNRRTGIDMAINYLNSLQPNAIIFTNGDNDTFPLWYAQEVEGVRRDVRVCNLSLLNTDWYVDQMKKKAYDSEPVPFTIREQKYRQGTRDVLFLDPYGDTKDYMNLRDALNYALDDANSIPNGDRMVAVVPSYKFKLPVDSAARELYRPFLKEGDSLVTEMRWEYADERGRPRSYITKAQLMALDLIANTDWTRPIYFAVTTGGEAYLGLERYFQLEGLAYRLTPILHKESPNPNLDGGVATDVMYENMLTRFQWGNMDKYPIYMDENNRRMTTNLRLQFSHLAEELIAEDKKDKAVEVLNKAMTVMPEHNVPFDQPQIMWHLSELYYEAGDSVAALNLTRRLIDLNNQEIDYYNSLDPSRQSTMERDVMLRVQINDRLIQRAALYFPEDQEVIKWEEENEATLKDFGISEEEETFTPPKTGPGVTIGGEQGIELTDPGK
jgi:tetratricopeptide (TPR) repeat protein/BMFP domain-containing protein YqiC